MYLRTPQVAFILIGLLQFTVGFLLFYPGIKSYLDTPIQIGADLSVNLCLASEEPNDKGEFPYVGREGVCPPPGLTFESRLQSTPQKFDVGEFYFTGDDHAVSLEFFITMSAYGVVSLSVSIDPEGNNRVYSLRGQGVAEKKTEGEGEVDSSKTITGYSTINIYRQQGTEWNLSGEGNSPDCYNISGCTYRPLLTAYLTELGYMFYIEKPTPDTQVHVDAIDMLYPSIIIPPPNIDVLIEFVNQDSDQQFVGLIYALVGAVLMDLAPGLWYFIWFRENEWFKKQVQVTRSIRATSGRSGLGSTTGASSSRHSVRKLRFPFKRQESEAVAQRNTSRHKSVRTDEIEVPMEDFAEPEPISQEEFSLAPTSEPRFLPNM